MKVEVQLACRKPRLVPGTKIKGWVEEALREHGGDVEVTVRIVGESEAAELNRIYRRKAGPTNVLSFPLEAPPGLPGHAFGDIAVCAPLVAAEAEAAGKSREAHLAHLVVHGALHLLGYDHQSARQAKRMEAAEVAVLARLGYPDPYAVPSAS